MSRVEHSSAPPQSVTAVPGHATGPPPVMTYILGSHGGESGTVALGEGYSAHIEAVRDEPWPEQPLRRRA